MASRAILNVVRGGLDKMVELRKGPSALEDHEIIVSMTSRVWTHREHGTVESFDNTVASPFEVMRLDIKRD